MDDKKKWDLRNKVYVEDLVYKYGVESAYEHPSHPFLLDMDDKCWEEVFISDRVDKIKSDGIFALEDCNDACQKMFVSSKNVEQEQSTIDQLWSKISEYGFINPRTHYDEYSTQMSILLDLDLYCWKTVDWIKNHGSKMDYTVRLDKSSVATTRVDTKDRVVSGIAPLPVLFREGNEYGAAECAKDYEYMRMPGSIIDNPAGYISVVYNLHPNMK
ncbi:hypothetical protein BDC45DRAFT_572256 [Circinella umbellata]|nr:hypothetical protein BDC45DRAFT_572256 [Circinella umbellata]